MVTRTMLTTRGSSPLARGLLFALLQSVEHVGIIPARAGFTSGTRASQSTATDHPRSRGVYPTGCGPLVLGPGSSPLARGLLPRASATRIHSTIIPARAGFTPRRAGRWHRRADHPRSRGVYGRGFRPCGGCGGSSPLARGLPAGRLASEAWSRIIPARAGFTRTRLSAPTSSGDHPRSRGVYDERNSRMSGLKGSSPLARGLQVRVRHVLPVRGIIPARAGFTNDHSRNVNVDWDHPRSRGVYSVLSSPCCVAVGSSPLARGLRVRVSLVLLDHGIIPARAGFTD